MLNFQVTTAGRDSLGLRKLCEQFCNDQWIGDHLDPGQAAAVVLDQFRRAVAAELKLLEVTSQDTHRQMAVEAMN